MQATRKKIVLIGGGGHAKVIINAIECSREFEIYGVVDPRLCEEDLVLGVNVIGTDDALPGLLGKGLENAFIAIGSVGCCAVRKQIYEKLKGIGFKLPVVAYPGASVAKDALIGEGTFIAAGVVINPGVKIGKNAIINTSTSLDHDCRIGDFVHVAPGVTLCGGVSVGNEAHVGAGATVIQGVNIGKGCIVGAGTTVRRHLADGDKYIGIPSVQNGERQTHV